MLYNLIIGKDSNLSKYISKQGSNCFLVSAREILNDVNTLVTFKEKKINIIFNNFQPSRELNNLKSPTAYVSNAMLVTSIVLEFFKDTDINKIIYTSSSSVYGNNILCKESDELKPMSLHASLKVANEQLIKKYCSDYNIDYTITRVFNMYGGDDQFSVISKIINAYLGHEKLTIVNNGNAIRDFIHIDDVVSIYMRILEINNINVLNIGSGYGSSIKNILDSLFNKGVVVNINNIFRDELNISTADISLLQDIIKKKEFININNYLNEKLKL